MPLGFLAPLFLAGLAAVAIPVALHLMRRHADPVVPFGAMRLIKRTPVEQVRRRRLRELLLLALRCAALTLLALSFARPYFVSAQAQGSAPLTVVAVDTSYSLSTRPQIERARQLASAAVDEAPSGGPVALITFDDKRDCGGASDARSRGGPVSGVAHRAAATGDSLRGGVVRGRRPVRQPRRTARDRDRPAAAWLGCGLTSRASIRCGG